MIAALTGMILRQPTAHVTAYPNPEPSPNPRI